jgi:hypothetical protein
MFSTLVPPQNKIISDVITEWSSKIRPSSSIFYFSYVLQDHQHDLASIIVRSNPIFFGFIAGVDPLIQLQLLLFSY